MPWFPTPGRTESQACQNLRYVKWEAVIFLFYCIVLSRNSFPEETLIRKEEASNGSLKEFFLPRIPIAIGTDFHGCDLAIPLFVLKILHLFIRVIRGKTISWIFCRTLQPVVFDAITKGTLEACRMTGVKLYRLHIL